MDDNLQQLPTRSVDPLTSTFKRFIHIESASGTILLLCTLVALAFSNSPWASHYSSFWETPLGFHFGNYGLTHSLKHWINDGLMTLFFFLVALELKRETVLGELRNWRLATLSFAGALGGMVVPAGVYLSVLRGGTGWEGWGTVVSTDTAFLIGCLAILGSRIPQSLRLFLLSLAIFDDIGAIFVIAFGYGNDLNLTALALAAAGVAVVVLIASLGIRNFPAYFATGGFVWLTFDASGIHPTIAGVILGLLTPARSWVKDDRLHAILERVIAYPRGEHWSGDTSDRQDLQLANTATREALSPVERLEIGLHSWVALLIVPAFAMANAGISFYSMQVDTSLTLAIFAGFVFGKPVGVVLFSYLAVRFRWAILPPELDWTLIFFGATLTGIGFTMALLIAELAFDDSVLNSVKLGILVSSIVSATVGLSALRWLASRRST
ncbi:Na+/H+ antiporter NhaA [Schlesneria sp. T3-172]|uniref:Na+/H+ antiporter NhaA n=1 Tax=Schlesneria sphaerica TaxID=3373610 RepID=UPI0037C767D3